MADSGYAPDPTEEGAARSPRENVAGQTPQHCTPQGLSAPPPQRRPPCPQHTLPLEAIIDVLLPREHEWKGRVGGLFYLPLWAQNAT